MRFSASGEIGGSSGEKMRCCRQFIILRYVSTRVCVCVCVCGGGEGGEVGEGGKDMNNTDSQQLAYINSK